MRKSILVAGVATLVLGMTGVAQAQTAPTAPSVSVTTSVSPTKSGTKAKPKNEKLTLSLKNDPGSKTTAKSISITFPSTLKLSTKGLDQCKASDSDLLKGPEKVCKKSIAGVGKANALLNPFAAAPGPLAFKVVPVVGNNEIIFVLSGAANAVLHGKISGKKLTITIPGFLQQPLPNTYSALNDLATTLQLKKGKNYLISSVGCTSKKHKIGVTVGYAPNPTQPLAPSATGTGSATCS